MFFLLNNKKKINHFIFLCNTCLPPDHQLTVHYLIFALDRLSCFCAISQSGVCIPECRLERTVRVYGSKSERQRSMSTTPTLNERLDHNHVTQHKSSILCCTQDFCTKAFSSSLSSLSSQISPISSSRFCHSCWPTRTPSTHWTGTRQPCTCTGRRITNRKSKVILKSSNGLTSVGLCICLHFSHYHLTLWQMNVL